MKLKSKLIMSGVALAACAATLTSTTYAWYTTNTEVQANNISGATADTGSASVFISDNGTNWYNKLDASSEGTDKITLAGSPLLPVTLSSEGKWIDQKSEEVASPSMRSFTLHFKTAKTNSPVKLGIHTITIKNAVATASLPTYENLLTGETYTANCLNALAFNMNSTTEADLYKTGYSLTPGSGCVSAASGYTYEEGTKISGYTAHTYVNAVASGSVTNTSTLVTTLTADDVTIVTLPADGTSKTVTFNIFLDGADEDCFDACKNQNFVVNFSFKVIEQASE